MNSCIDEKYGRSDNLTLEDILKNFDLTPIGETQITHCENYSLQVTPINNSSEKKARVEIDYYTKRYVTYVKKGNIGYYMITPKNAESFPFDRDCYERTLAPGYEPDEFNSICYELKQGDTENMSAVFELSGEFGSRHTYINLDTGLKKEVNGFLHYSPNKKFAFSTDYNNNWMDRDILPLEDWRYNTIVISKVFGADLFDEFICYRTTENKYAANFLIYDFGQLEHSIIYSFNTWLTDSDFIVDIDFYNDWDRKVNTISCLVSFRAT